MNTQKTYSKKELLAMLPSKKDLGRAINTTHCAGDISYSERDMFEVENITIERCADALADRIQKPQALSLSDCNKIVGIVSDLLSPLLTQKSREYMAAIIYAELKKGK